MLRSGSEQKSVQLRANALTLLPCLPFPQLCTTPIFQSIIYYQFSRFRIAKEFYESSALWATLTNGLISYTAHFEIIGHTMIAFNRYNAFRQIDVSKTGWSKRLIQIICAIMIVVPFCMYVYRFPFEIRYRFTDTGTGVSVSFTLPEIQKVCILIENLWRRGVLHHSVHRDDQQCWSSDNASGIGASSNFVFSVHRHR